MLWRSLLKLLLIPALVQARSFAFRRSHIVVGSANTHSRNDRAVDFSARSVATTLRGGQFSATDMDVSDVIEHSFEWNANLGAPAALVAGAVIGTLYENIRSGDLELNESDVVWVKFAKKATRVLLMSAFLMEVACIFVTTVTGTVLLSRPLFLMDDNVAITKSTTPLGFMRGNFEFEYLTARITFLQGLLNWLSAITLSHLIPNESTDHAQKMNRFLGTSLATTILLMLSFYNGHMTFYANYPSMVKRWLVVCWRRFIWQWPLRPLAIVFVPAVGLSLFQGYQVFFGGDSYTDILKEEYGWSESEEVAQ